MYGTAALELTTNLIYSVWSQEQEIQIKRHVASYSACADTVGLNVTEWIHSVRKNNRTRVASERVV